MMFRLASIAVASVILAVPAFAEDCKAVVEGNDAMQYNTNSILVPKACKKFTIELKHVGKLPKATMGHNLAISKASDMAGIVKDGIAMGLANNYRKPDDPRVIAATKIIGGGESASVTFDVSKLAAGETYNYFCTFPGHSALMKGTIAVK